MRSCEPDRSFLRAGLNFVHGHKLRHMFACRLRAAATVDDLRWVEYSADASVDEATDGWMLRVVGKGQKEREVPVPMDVVAELARYLISRGLDPDLEDIGNQGAQLLGKAIDAAERVPGLKGRLQTGERLDPREGLAAATSYDQIKAFFTHCAGVLRGQGDAIAGGMPIEIAQQNLGHASLATTTVHVTTESKRRL